MTESGGLRPHLLQQARVLSGNSLQCREMSQSDEGANTGQVNNGKTDKKGCVCVRKKPNQHLYSFLNIMYSDK